MRVYCVLRLIVRSWCTFPWRTKTKYKILRWLYCSENGCNRKRHSHFLNIYLLRLQSLFLPYSTDAERHKRIFFSFSPQPSSLFLHSLQTFRSNIARVARVRKNTAVLQSNTYSFKRSIIPLCNLPQFCHRCCLVCLLSPQLQSRASQQRSRIGSNGTNSFYFQNPRQRGYKENYLHLDRWCPEWLPRLSSSHQP